MDSSESSVVREATTHYEVAASDLIAGRRDEKEDRTGDVVRPLEPLEDQPLAVLVLDI